MIGGRKKTKLEFSETADELADRLRGALFAAYNAKTLKEAKRICWCAMGGKLHGKEPKKLESPK